MQIQVHRNVVYFSNFGFVIDFETFVSTGDGCQSLPTNKSNNYGVVFRDTLFIGFRFFKVWQYTHGLTTGVWAP